MRSLLALLIASTAFCQDPQAAALALRPPGTVYSEAMLDSVQREVEQAIARIPRAQTKSDVENARPLLRKSLMASLGLERLPKSPDLKPAIAGIITRTGYRIEKIVFQTLPSLRVPAHLYLPAEPQGRIPAVLLYPGHSWTTEGKAHQDAQLFASNMARMGFGVLVFDPIGQGERGPSPDDFKITRMLLAGLSQPGIAEYEVRCALDYLVSRPEIDAARIGMAGADGGGLMTWITAAVDNRIAAAAIADDTEDFGDVIRRNRENDWNHAEDQRALIPGILRYANNHELLTMFAPHPLLIISNKEQFGQNASVRSIFDYGADIYGRFGGNGKIQIFNDSDDGPGFQHPKRQAVYAFFLRSLMGSQDPQPLVENPGDAFPPPDSPDLRCLSPGESSPAVPAIMAAVRDIAARLPDLDTNLEIRDLLQPWPPNVRYGWGINGTGVQRFVYGTQRGGYSIPWLHMRTLDGTAGMLIALDDRGKEALVNDPIVLEALKRGYSVSAIDMRGIGELTGHPGWLFAANLLLGDNVEWKQAWDTLILLDEWQDFAPSHRTGLYANGPMATMAAEYVMSMRTGTAPQWVVMRNGVTSFRDLLDLPAIPDWAILFNALGTVDLMHPYVGSALADRRAWVISPVDPAHAAVTTPAKVRIATIDQFLSADW